MYYFKLPDIPDLRMKFIEALKQLVYVLFMLFPKKKKKIENELIRPKELKYNATGRYMYSKNIFIIARSQSCNEINQYSSI